MQKVLYLRLLLSLLCILGVSHLNAQQTVFTGSCGAAANDNLTWTLDTESNLLTISGSGAMADYDNSDNKAPWLSYADEDLVYLKLEEGLTHIGDYAFYNRTFLDEVKIPTTVTSIGEYAFYRCLAIHYLWALPETAPTIESTTFQSTNVNRFFYNHKDSSYDSGWWATYLNNRYEIYVDKVGDNLLSIVSPNSGSAGRHIITGTGAMYDYERYSNLPPYKTWIDQYPCEHLSIEEGITHIGDCAFYGSSYYKSYSTPRSVETIGDFAFNGCFTDVNNAHVILIGLHLDKLTEIGYGAFGGAQSGISGLPESLVRIGNEAFYNCYFSDNTLSIPSKVEYIGDHAFYDCTNLTGDIVIPNSVTYLGSYAFYQCSGFDGTLTLSENLTTIDISTFEGCSSLTGTLTIPEKVETIKGFAFRGTNITGELIIPDNVTSIESYAFSGCNITGTLTIPNSITSISRNCFANTSITELVLHDGITDIGNEAFQNCSSLSKVTSLATTAPTLETNVFTGISADATLYYPSAGEQSYTDKGWMQYFSNSINQMCGDFAFYDIDLSTGKLIISGSGAMWDYDGTNQAPWRQYATQITSVEISGGITSIGKNAFYGMSALTGAVNIPASVTLIDEYAFALCTGISELTLSEGLTNINNYAFYTCVALDKVTTYATTAPSLGNDVFVNIPNDAALYCPTESEADYIAKGWDNYFDITATDIYGGQCGDNITWLLTPSTGELKITGTGAMWDYDNTTNIAPWRAHKDNIKLLTLSEGITHVGNQAFRELDKVEQTLTLPSTLVSIGDYAFVSFGTDGIGALTLPESLTTLGQIAFRRNYFSEINISSNIVDIPRLAFAESYNITEITIPEGVQSIGDGAFNSCNNIVTCTALAPTAPTLGENVFSSSIYETASLYYHADGEYVDGWGGAWEYYFANCYAIYRGTCGENAYWTLNVTTGELRIYGTGAMNNFGSTSKPTWYNYRESIRSIRIEEGITNVGNYAFFYDPYTNLTSFTLANTVTSIGNNAFRNSGLTGTITLPNSVTSIGQYAFSDCTGITKLNIEGAATIGQYAFSDCTGLTSIAGSDISKVTSIGNYAFQNCTGLTSVVIPSYVTSIGNYAFNGCTEITRLGFEYRMGSGTHIIYKLPIHNLTTIGDYAFDGCSNLLGDVTITQNPKEDPIITYLGLVIPYSVQTIGDYAFRNCTSIIELNFKDNAIRPLSQLTSIGDYAFSGCTGIMGDLDLSRTRLTEIGYHAFNGCRFGTERKIGQITLRQPGTVKLPATLLTIRDYAFYETYIGTINFPEALTSIGAYAFAETSLRSVNLAKTNISSYGIGNAAFMNCTNLSSLQLPLNENFTQMHRSYIFKGCTSLKEVIIPNNITDIGTESFYGCTALERVVLPNNLDYPTGISSLAFGRCPNIKEVYATQVPPSDEYASFMNTLAPYSESSWNNNQQESGAFTVNTPIDNGSAVLYIPKGATDAYTYRTGSGQYPNEWEKQFPVMIEGIYSGQCGDNAYYVGNDASYYYHSETQTTYQSKHKLLITGYGDMYDYDETYAPWMNYSHVDTLNISNDITSIGNEAFYGSYIDVVIGGSGITHVGDYGFASNYFPTISIADNAYIGNYAFQNCTRLEYDDFIANASYIGDYAFYNCDGLVLDTELNLKNATYIGDRAFYDCDGFTGGLKIGKATTIGPYAFYQVNFTGSLVIPESVTSLGAYAFYGCDNFNGTLTLPNTLETINNYTFSGCSGFTGELIIPESVTSIGDRGFSSCSNFTGTLVIPENIVTIGSSAFSTCYGFTALELNDNISSIGSSAFHYCTAMTGELVLPNKLNKIDNSAFNSVPFTDVVVFRTEPATLGTMVFNAITGNIYIPYQFRDAYLANANWATYNSNNKLVSMPTYTPLTISVNHWVGLSGGIEPTATDRVALNTALAITDGKTLTIESFGYCGLNEEVYGSLTIEDGGQLYHNKAYNEATVEKNIIGYAGQQSTDNGQQTSWYTIASPLKEAIDLSNSNTFITSTPFDLYRYDEPTHTWQNAKEGEGSTNFQTIEPGRGYLYANAENTTLEFTGMLNTDAVTYDLTVDSEVLNGFHLIGNPFTHDITFNHLSADAELANGYYVLNGEGAWGATLGNEGDVIKAGQGALIKTTDAGTLTISRDASMIPTKSTNIDTSKKSIISLNISNANYSDKAFLVFDKGVGLDKINHENENIPLLYIPQGDTDYAIAMMDENVNEIPVSFETMTMGQYTISLQQENCDFNELYLLDKETGEKVNILEESYTFMATSSDNSERFVLLKDNGQQTTDNSHFAYVSGEELIINAEGVVQIIDVMGRIIYSNDVRSDNNRINVSGFTNAAYLVRCINGNDVKVQKIVIQ